MTVRLYHQDPLLTRFAARVVAHGEVAGRASLVLDQTGFYPEAGGQMADRGQLAGSEVTDVQVDDAGRVHHMLGEGAALPGVGSEVAGEIEWRRRRAHMALHTAQHMLSRALLEVARGETVSARLGETACTIDIQLAKLAEADLARAEELTCAVIDDDLAIRAFFPEPDELLAMKLRREPKVESSVRVVQIGEFDTSPCGGTHCTRTAQVGLVRVLGVERYKGMQRVTFEAGARARTLLGRHSEVLRGASQSLACGPTDVAEAIARLRAEVTAARDDAGRVREALAERLAAGLPREGDRVVCVLDGGDLELARLVAKRIIRDPAAVALIAAASPAGLDIVAWRGSAASFDCGAFVKRTCSEHGGRGGGRPERAEGRLPPGVDWPGACRG